MKPLTIDEIADAHAVVSAEAIRTPARHSANLDGIIGGEVLAKAESLQRAGSFKFRGAYHRLHRIPQSDRPRGVVAVSSGNHGAAVACAAQLLHMPATVFIPDDAPAIKRSLIEGFGAQIRTFARSTPDREADARKQCARTGATFVHPFEDRDVMVGQGTTALELHQQVGALDVLLAPMSGGGLMAGCASAMRVLAPSCRLVGVEPAMADDTRRSMAAGRRVAIESAPTIADGLALLTPGEQTFALNRRLIDEVVTVSEDAIVAAMGTVFDDFDLVVEPSGAVGIAALETMPDRWRGQRVGVILSGGNVDRDHFRRLTGR